jgi:hypothetical protein
MSESFAINKSLGATECIDYKVENYVEKFSATRPFDVGIDCIGESLNLVKVVKAAGSIVSIVDGITGGKEVICPIIFITLCFALTYRVDCRLSY